MATSIALSAATVTAHFSRGRTRMVFSKGSSFPISSSPQPQLQPHRSNPRCPLKIPLLPKTTIGISSAHFSPPIASTLLVLEEEVASPSPPPPITVRRIVLWVLVWTPLTLLMQLLACGAASAAVAAAADDSIKASGIGVKIAAALRGSGWADEAIVFALATLPVLELRGAIPVGYWMQLNPLHLTALSILGNMVPVPFIVLYLKKFASFLSRNNASATQFLDLLFKRAREKAGPVEEFQWLGLMLFVAVPFPGTGAWTGAIVASVLDMPFWSAISANFFGIVLAGLLVNLLVNVGLKYAIATGLLLFFISTVMWSVLRYLKKSLNSQ